MAALLVRVDAPYFVAALVIVDDICTEAVPILRWTIGKTRSELRAHFTKRGWVAMSIADPLIRR